jgi:hypothetical protein
MKLYEVKHPYYCSETNCRVDGLSDPPRGHMEHSSWEDFLNYWGEEDPDRNLLFRWDWRTTEEDGEEDRFEAFWILQGRGDFLASSFPVKREEEAAIREWLEERFEKIQAIWAPFTSPPGDESGQDAIATDEDPATTQDEQCWTLEEILSDDTHHETTDSRSLGRRTMTLVISCEDSDPEPFQVGHGLAVRDEMWDVAEVVSSSDSEAADHPSADCRQKATIVVTAENAIPSRHSEKAPDSLLVGDSLELVTGGLRFEMIESGSMLFESRPESTR